MSRKDYLAVWFHFDGKFVKDKRTLEYVGGEDAMSMIPRERCGRRSQGQRNLKRSPGAAELAELGQPLGVENANN